jgi:hypothetical protein
MITITVRTGVSYGSLVATASANVMTRDEAAHIQIDNQTSSLLYVEQMIPQTWVTEPAATYSPIYENLGVVGPPANQTQPVEISNGAAPKVYLGFGTGTDTAWPDAQTLFGNVPRDDSWFLMQTPPAGPIVPLRISGSVDAVLTPQTDT